MRRLFIILNALTLMGVMVGCSQLDHDIIDGGCNCGAGGMVGGSEMVGDGVMMGSSGMSSGIVVNGSSQPSVFMGMPQMARPIVSDEPPTH